MTQVLRLRGVRAIVKPPGVDEKDEACPERLLLLAVEVKEEEGKDTPVLVLEGRFVTDSFTQEESLVRS